MSRQRDWFAKGFLNIAAAAAVVVWLVTTAQNVMAQGSPSGRALEYDIPAQPLESALQSVADKLKLQILYSPGDLKGISTRGLKGSYSTKDAIDRLLEGTGLAASFDGQNAVAIKPRLSEKKTGSQGDTSISGSSFLAEAQKRGGDDLKRIESVEVTGSRLKRSDVEGPVDVKVYSSEQIRRSGQVTIAGFLASIPQVSQTQNESNTIAGGQTTIRLRGLPTGTTLLLLNGRRIESGALQVGAGQFFDLSNIPASLVERIEVLPFGASAVYGSDALAGVVNIILKSMFSGREASVTYGHATGTDDVTLAGGLGHAIGDFSISLFANYFKRSELNSNERDLTSSADYRRFGGPDLRQASCGDLVRSTSTGNLPGLTSAFAAIPAGLQGRPSTSDFVATAGQASVCSIFANRTLFPATERVQAYAKGEYQLGPQVFFAELLGSRLRQDVFSGSPSFSGQRVSASNPYNPFGVDVLVTRLLRGTGIDQAQRLKTDYSRFVFGGSGPLGKDMEWVAHALRSENRNTEDVSASGLNQPALVDALTSSSATAALNPFSLSNTGSPDLLTRIFTTNAIKAIGRYTGATAFVRGPLMNAPGGLLNVVFGGEIGREYQTNIQTNRQTQGTTFSLEGSRSTKALFSEARIPFLPPTRAGAAEALVASVAFRANQVGGFGRKDVGQGGLEWRPISTLLFRSAYSEAFNAPQMGAIHAPTVSFANTPVNDPIRNETARVNAVTIASPDLQPETGKTYSLGLVFAPEIYGAPQLSVTAWQIKLENKIANIGTQGIVNFESLFPTRVIREPSIGTVPGPIQTVYFGYFNYSTYELKGIDLDVSAKFALSGVALSPHLAISRTSKFSYALVPGTPTIDALGTAVATTGWAPKWKGVAGVDWIKGAFSGSLSGRYVGKYKDYDRIGSLGDFWLVDAYVATDLPAFSSLLGKGRFAIGVTNLLDRTPSYSNTGSSSSPRYDATQEDIVGRRVFVQVSWAW